jgi:signal transduction histidine kinase
MAARGKNMAELLEDPTITELKGLRVAIQKLKSYSLPVETRAAIAEASNRTDKLIQQLSAKSGQSRLAALYNVSQVLGTSLDLDQVLNQVMDAVIDLTGAERGFLMLLEGESGELLLKAARDIDHATLERKDMEVSRTIIRNVVEHGEGILSTDAQQDPRFAGTDSIVFFALRSVLCAPLRARGKVIGVVYVDNRAQSGIFTAGDLDLLNAFANQAAIAIENARLYTQTDQALSARIAELEIISHIDQELNERLDFNRVIAITCHWALEGTGASRVWLVRSSEEGLSPVSDPEGELSEGLRQLVLNTLKEDKVTTIIELESGNAYLSAPVHCSGKALFVLAVERAEPFGDLLKSFLFRLAGRAGAALENARLYQAVQDANSAKTKFVSVVTHELRIPMTSIKGYTDLLRQGAVGPVNEMQTNFLNVVKNNVDRMSTLVSDLSDISHIETGRIKLSCALMSAGEAVQDTVTNLQPRIKEKGQELFVELEKGLPQVYADPTRLVQVLTNLLNNAHKYTPENGKLNLRAKVYGDRVRFEVQDNGIGISPEDQKSLFSQFFRSESPQVREQQGWGLGLNLANRLVNLMGGEMGMQSELGVGSTFWFTLPTQAT